MTTAMVETSPLERLVPSLPLDAVTLDAPVVRVTLLEDRAQVERKTRVMLKAGQNRVLVPGAATVIQDVSLRAEASSGASVVDVRARRAMRIRLKDRPENARVLEESLEALRQRYLETREDQQRAAEQSARVRQILEHGVDEVPVDAGWGILNRDRWTGTFESLFNRARTLRESMLRAQFTAEDLSEEINALIRQRQAIDRPDQTVVAWLEADVLCPSDGEVELRFEYVVPNALWRPMHSAQLLDSGKIRFSSSAAVWQHTGEDWKDAELHFSTARSSLGTEPPLLSDDLLSVKKKSEQVVVQARQVAVQRAGLGSGGAAPASTAVDLPGVDDGGQVRTLKAAQKSTVPSDGRPCMVPLFTFEGEAETALVCLPELEEKAFLRSVQRNSAPHPILAGPVELLLNNGFVGWTQTMFVAPQERFELSFGPDDAVRVLRKDHKESEKDHVDKWNRTTIQVALYVSNLSGEPRTVELTERIPVSEIEHVRIELLEDKTSPGFKVDENGFVKWRLELEGLGHLKVRLTYRVSTAPDVKGL